MDAAVACPYTCCMRLQSLRALIAIAEQGSFSEAALELGTSQSAMSYAIAELEDELGVRLLDRGRFGAVPTDVGRNVLAHARRVEGALDAIRQEAALDRGVLQGVLRIGAFRSAATQILPRVLADLGRRHPGLRIDVLEVASRCVDPVAHLHQGTVDVALTMSYLADDVVFWELLRDAYVAVAPATLPIQTEPMTLDALLEHPLILSDGPCSWPARTRLSERDPSFHPAYEISEDSTILGLVAQGLGVAVMPELTLDAFPTSLRRIPLADPCERVIGVAMLPGALKVPGVRAFLASVRSLYPAGEVPHLGGTVPAGA